jgi:hypothetical protein
MSGGTPIGKFGAHLTSMSEPLAPRMVRWSSLGMRLQEMVQDMQQGHHMLLVASDELGLPNIVDNHVQNFFAAVLLGQEVRCLPSALMRQIG